MRSLYEYGSWSAIERAKNSDTKMKDGIQGDIREGVVQRVDPQKGDDYFNLMDDWFEKNLLLGTQLPRDEAVIRQSMVQSIAENPAFSGFADDTRFLTVIQRLEQLTTEPADPVTKE